jgi:proliferating cell nuclear antigen
MSASSTNTVLAAPTRRGGHNCLELRTVQAAAFKVLVEALKELLTDTCVEFDETGMKVVATDTSHVVLVHLKLEASKFELYHCDGRVSIGVNMLNMHKLIRTVNNNDTLTLFIDSDDVNHLCIRIENSEKSSRTTYRLNLLDLDHRNISVDPTDFTDVVTLPSVDFQKICRDMNNIAEFMEIKSIRNQLIFSCKGDFCSQETIISDNEAASVEQDQVIQVDASTAKSDGIVQGVFSLKHLVLFTKCTNLCSTMELYLKNDYPLIIKYDVSSLGSIRLALAPQS